MVFPGVPRARNVEYTLFDVCRSPNARTQTRNSSQAAATTGSPLCILRASPWLIATGPLAVPQTARHSCLDARTCPWGPVSFFSCLPGVIYFRGRKLWRAIPSGLKRSDSSAGPENWSKQHSRNSRFHRKHEPVFSFSPAPIHLSASAKRLGRNAIQGLRQDLLCFLRIPFHE